MSDISDTQGKNSLPTAGEIAEMAAKGGDFTSYYTRRCITIKPIRRVNVHLTKSLLGCVDAMAARLNVSREAAMNILLRRALMQQTQPQPAQPQKPQSQSQ